MPETRRKPGRPPRISRDDIARAVVEIGIEAATVKAVAARLGVSTAGLYHHVNGQEDLRRIAGELLLATHDMPRHTGQPWPAWLRAVAWYLRARLTAHPLALVQHVEGAVTDEGVVNLEYALGVLRRFGFSPTSALDAFQAVGQLAFGASGDDVREQVLARSGRATMARLHSILALDPDALPHIRELLADREPGQPDRFDDRLTIVLQGIAAEVGEPWDRAQSRTVAPS